MSDISANNTIDEQLRQLRAKFEGGVHVAPIPNGTPAELFASLTDGAIRLAPATGEDPPALALRVDGRLFLIPFQEVLLSGGGGSE